jgi:hypothetical protein
MNRKYNLGILIQHQLSKGFNEFEPDILFESPFSDINTSGIMGVFDDTTSRKIISLITSINDTAEVA